MNKRYGVGVVVTALVLVMLIPATAQAVTRITMTRSNFQPAHASASRGERVRWSNTSNIIHNVVATSSNWNKHTTLSPGEATGFTFNSNGTYRYRCTRHTGMDGRITVG